MNIRKHALLSATALLALGLGLAACGEEKKEEQAAAPAAEQPAAQPAAPAAEATPAGKPAEHPQCATARKNLDILGHQGPVQQDTDGDGKPDATLDDTARANQRALAEAAVKAYCKPGG